MERSPIRDVAFGYAFLGNRGPWIYRSHSANREQRKASKDEWKRWEIVLDTSGPPGDILVATLAANIIRTWIFTTVLLRVEEWPAPMGSPEVGEDDHTSNRCVRTPQ
jgi:hypothetical protein